MRNAWQTLRPLPVSVSSASRAGFPIVLTGCPAARESPVRERIDTEFHCGKRCGCRTGTVKSVVQDADC